MAKKEFIHVLHIASGDIWAGAESQLYTLARSLKQSHEVMVSVVLMNHGHLENKLLDSGVDVTIFDETQFNGLQIALRLYSLFKIKKPDIIHTHGKKETILSSIALLFKKNTVSIRTAHGAPEHRPSFFLFHKWLYNTADWFCGRFMQKRIIAVSEDLKTKLAKKFPVDKITVIQNGVDIQDVTRILTAKSIHRPADTKVFRIGLAGRLVAVKRVDIFIEVAKYFISQYPEIPVTFHIYGTGPMEQELKLLHKQSGTGQSLVFEGHSGEMTSHLASLDLLTLVSDHEGLPMILLEAMACRTPIIAHAVGGIPELLDQGRCGVLISNQKPADYASAIHFLLKNPENRQRLSLNAFERLSEHYSSQSNAAAYIDTYLSLAN